VFREILTPEKILHDVALDLIRCKINAQVKKRPGAAAALSELSGKIRQDAKYLKTLRKLKLRQTHG
jgi:hypothetical protein